jgi:hypothetical protein
MDKRNNAHLIAALALSSGESIGAGMARMALSVTLNLVDEAELEVVGQRRTLAGMREVLMIELNTALWRKSLPKPRLSGSAPTNPRC